MKVMEEEEEEERGKLTLGDTIATAITLSKVFYGSAPQTKAQMH